VRRAGQKGIQSAFGWSRGASMTVNALGPYPYSPASMPASPFRRTGRCGLPIPDPRDLTLPYGRNTASVAAKHYLQTTNVLIEQAVQNPVQQAAAVPRNAPLCAPHEPKNPRKRRPATFSGVPDYPAGTRTPTDRSRICSATITPRGSGIDSQRPSMDAGTLSVTLSCVKDGFFRGKC
jgi:hypothetical protein